MRTPCQTREYLVSALWTSDSPYDRAQAVQLCGPCPIAEACRQGALERREVAAVYGGVDFTSNYNRLLCGFPKCENAAAGFARPTSRGKVGDLVVACRRHTDTPTIAPVRMSGDLLAEMVAELLDAGMPIPKLLEEIGGTAASVMAALLRAGRVDLSRPIAQWETRNDATILGMQADGCTLRQIGDATNLTTEQVKTRLRRYAA